MIVISAAEIDRVLAVPDVIEALADAFRQGGEAPVRHHHELVSPGGHGTHLLMPAWSPGAPGPDLYLGTKIVNVFPGNRDHGLPAVLGVYLLQSGETGAPLAVLDGTRLTHWRTAAASALAARFLARSDARRLLMVGAGALAPFLVRAHAAVRPIDHVTVWNHRLESAEALVEDLRGQGFNAHTATDLKAAVAEADVVSCATLSTQALVRGAWLNPGTHVDLVGAFTMAMREIDDEALRRARVFVDTPAALHEGGDVARAIEAGVIDATDVVATLHDLCGATAGRQTDDEVTLFKSVGTAIEDLAAATLVWRRITDDPSRAQTA